MEIFLQFVRVFITGGTICAIAQILMDKTSITSARILVLFLVLGAFMTSIGIYEKIVMWGSYGATVPITGFGYALIKGVFQEIDKVGLIGVFTGGIKATSAGITSSMLFGYITALIAKPDIKK